MGLSLVVPPAWLAANKSYQFKVTASYPTTGSAVMSPDSNYATLAVPSSFPSLPVAPTGMMVVSVNTAGAFFKWNDNATNETYYILQKSTTGGGPWTDYFHAANTTRASLGALTYGATFYFRVAASNAVGRTYSNVVTAVPGSLQPNPTLSPPTNLTAVAGAVARSVRLSWGLASGNTGYFLERAVGSTGQFQHVAATGSAVSAYTVPSLPVGLHRFRIRATGLNGTTSQYTAEKNFTVQ
jgi:hypothetical protein